MLKASPISAPQSNSVAERPDWQARIAAPQASSISRISSGSTPLERDTATNDGNKAQPSPAASAARVPKRRATIT